MNRRGTRSSDYAELDHFAEDSKVIYKNYNAGAQLLFCSSKRLFGEFLVAVFVVVCLSSLLRRRNTLDRLATQHAQIRCVTSSECDEERATKPKFVAQS